MFLDLELSLTRVVTVLYFSFSLAFLTVFGVRETNLLLAVNAETSWPRSLSFRLSSIHTRQKACTAS
jgi:hypothetical protein